MRYDYVFKNGVTQWLLLWISPKDCVNTVLNVSSRNNDNRNWNEKDKTTIGLE